MASSVTTQGFGWFVNLVDLEIGGGCSKCGLNSLHNPGKKIVFLPTSLLQSNFISLSHPHDECVCVCFCGCGQNSLFLFLTEETKLLFFFFLLDSRSDYRFNSKKRLHRNPNFQTEYVPKKKKMVTSPTPLPPITTHFVCVCLFLFGMCFVVVVVLAMFFVCFP